MSTEILQRAVVTFVIIALGVLLYWAWNRWQLFRLRQAQAARAPGLEALPPGKAAVLYFTTDDCGVCRTQQKPALERLKADLGASLQIIEINATERPFVADHWGVLSVPTTFIIDTTGQPRRLNHGFTGYSRLAAQLAEFLPAHRAGEAVGRLAHE